MNWLSSRLYDRFMRHCEEASLQGWRRELLADAEGTVVEVGAGTGANIEFYPQAVDRVILTEPDPYMRAQLGGRLEQMDTDRFVVDEHPVEQLEVQPGSVDTVVVTLVLCSVQDPLEALEAMYEVLRPGGALIFMEHVAAQRRGRHRMQRMIEPVWKLCAGNCHLTRRSGELIPRAGFQIERLDREEIDTFVPILRPAVRGVARRPGGDAAGGG